MSSQRSLGTLWRLAAACGLVAVLGAACVSGIGPLNRVGSPPYERGSGTAGTETRTLTQFHAIEVGQGITATVEAGTTDGVTVTADDNLLGHVETFVSGGTLQVRITGSIETRLTPKVVVTASGQLDTVAATSAASVEIRHLEVSSLSVRANSAASVRVAGRADRLDLVLDSAGAAELGDLSVVDATVSIGTASRATARVTNSVSGSCLTASTLHLLGQPRTQSVTTDITSKVSIE